MKTNPVIKRGRYTIHQLPNQLIKFTCTTETAVDVIRY